MARIALLKLSLFLVFCSGVTLVVVAYRRHQISEKLENVLSFSTFEINECIIQKIEIGPQSMEEHRTSIEQTTGRLEDAAASDFAREFAALTRQYCRKIVSTKYDYIYLYTITFKNEGTLCEFKFDYILDKEALIEYKSGTLILNKKAGPKLVSVVENVLKDANDFIQSK